MFLENVWQTLLSLAIPFLIVRFILSTDDVLSIQSRIPPETTLYSTLSSLFPSLVLTT